MNEYISYGFNKFDRQRFENEIDTAILNERIDKPANGWWGSPIDANYGWKDWCFSARHGNCDDGTYGVDYIKWKLNDAKIYHIQKFADLANLPIVMNERCHKYGIDFDKLKTDGYDGIEICMDDYYFGHVLAGTDYVLEYEPELTQEQAEKACMLEELINTWDCDSICVWNSKVVEIIEEKTFEDIWKKYEEGIADGSVKQEVENFFKTNFGKIKENGCDYVLSLNENYNVKLTCRRSNGQARTDIFENKDIDEIIENYTYPTNYFIFKEIQEKATKIKTYLSIKDKIMEKAKEISKNLTDEQRIELFENTLPEEAIRHLFPATFSNKDYIETLKKHNIELTENFKEEEAIIAYNEETEI